MKAIGKTQDKMKSRLQAAAHNFGVELGKHLNEQLLSYYKIVGEPCGRGSLGMFTWLLRLAKAEAERPKERGH
jgi:hypothetical protein